MPTSYLLLDLPFDIVEEAFLDRFIAAADEISPSDAEFVQDEQNETPTQTATRFLNFEGEEAITIWEDRVAQLRYLEISAESDLFLQRALKNLSPPFQDHRASDGAGSDCPSQARRRPARKHLALRWVEWAT